MLIPQPGRLRRWLQRDQGRPVFPGLFLPIWWDLRLQQPQGPVYGRDDQIDNDDDTAFLQYPLYMGRIGYQTFVPDDIVSLMQQQRTINIRLLGINHRFAFAQVNLEEPLAQQLRANWPLPRHRASDLLAVHYVPFPPNTIGSADEQLYLIELNDDRFTQVNTDDVLVLFSLISFTAPDAVRTQKIRVLWSPKRVTRELILTFLRLRWFCEQPETLCLLYLNNIHWPAGDAAIRSLVSGDHVRVQFRSEQIHWTDLEYSEDVECSRRIFASRPQTFRPQPDDPLSEDQAGDSPSTARSRSTGGDWDDLEYGEDDEEESTSLLQLSAHFGHAEPASQPDMRNLSGLPHVVDRWCASHVEFSMPDCLAERQAPRRLSLNDMISPPQEVIVPCPHLQFVRNQLLQFDLGTPGTVSQLVKWHPATQDAFCRNVAMDWRATDFLRPFH